MAASYPSVQSFYRRELPKPVRKDEAEPFQVVKVGDGFTEEELTEALDPLTRKWNPEREYDQMTIGQLVPGPKAVTFMGRIVNFSTVFGHSQKQPKASGWHYMILKDDSAAISVCYHLSQLFVVNADFSVHRSSCSSPAKNILLNLASFSPCGLSSSPTPPKPIPHLPTSS
jgi:hypothetical protein